MKSTKIKEVRLLILFVMLSVFSSCKNEVAGDVNLRVISFNLRYDTSWDKENQWGNRKQACIKMLQEKNPDILGIQEGLYNQVEFLEENLLGYDYVGVGRDDGVTKGEYSAVFYSTKRFELLENGDFWLSQTPDEPSLGWDASNIRICTWAKLMDKTNKKNIFIFNTHFDHRGDVAQEESSKLIVKKIDEIATADVPIFLVGDFNLLLNSPKIQPITAHYASAQQNANKSDNYATFNAFGEEGGGQAIDFIFYKNATVQTYETIVADYGVPYISDHYPVLADFTYTIAH